MPEMTPSHVEPSRSLLFESPRMSSGSLHLSSSVSLEKGIGVSKKKYNEIFSTARTSPRTGSGSRFTSLLSAADYHKRRPRFFYSREDREIISMSFEKVPEFDTTPLEWIATLSHENGSTSVVQAFACKNEKGDPDYLAVKQVPFDDDRGRRKAFEEVELLEKARHKHIIACLGSYVYENNLCIMQYPVAKYNLAQFLQRRSDLLESHTGDKAREIEHIARIKHYFACLCNALEHLHDSKIKHRDIKPENILIDRNNTVLLTDFDISKEYRVTTFGKSEGRTQCTVKYSPKEVCKGEPRDISSDVFSLGCVFLEMATVYLGFSIRRLYKEIGPFEEGNDFYLIYWESVCQGRVKDWISRLRSKCDLVQGEDAFLEMQSQPTRTLSPVHLHKIEEMMSNGIKFRPELSDVRRAFENLQDECEDCRGSIRDRGVPERVITMEQSSSLSRPSSLNNAAPGVHRLGEKKSSHEVSQLPIIKEHSRPPMHGPLAQELQKDNEHDVDFSSDLPSPPRIFRPGKNQPIKKLKDAKKVPGKGVIVYDPDNGTFSTSTKNQIKYSEGILIRLPRGDGWRFKTINGDVNLWRSLQFSTNLRRVFGSTRMMFQRGSYPDEHLEVSTM